jgi:hypothetical protein
MCHTEVLTSVELEGLPLAKPYLSALVKVRLSSATSTISAQCTDRLWAGQAATAFLAALNTSVWLSAEFGTQTVNVFKPGVGSHNMEEVCLLVPGAWLSEPLVLKL